MQEQQPTSPHSIDANQEHVESPRGEDDWALVTFVGEKIQDPRYKKAMEKEARLEQAFQARVQRVLITHQGVPLHSRSRITHPTIRYVHRFISSTFQCKQEGNKVTTDEFYILTTLFIKHDHKANLGLLFAKTLINVRHLAKDLENNKKLCVRFGRLITAIVQHVGITIPNYEPLPNPIPLDLHDLQQIHFLNRWTQNPTKFCYEFPIGPTNTLIVLLPHEDIPSLRSGVVTFQPKEEDFYIPSREKPSLPILTYRTLQRTVKAQRRHQERHVLSTGMAANQALDRVSKLEKIVECQSRFISRLVRVVRHIAPERLFRPSLTARKPYEPDLGEFSLDSELGSEGDGPIEEEESSSHRHT
ncbi:unnamed protein product [Microthlaspi erraticum]|uniref:Arabidopsis retrotransposon Orf1 C-terminal domain-containing protein n=1 Tax=Microthlaspi erraticum TaxID=1685480 RepID=A0A6D2JRX5_9BRAS|nr:unnamed protein product [Microthlaspi erraticum]